jgi:hypothetical protein
LKIHTYFCRCLRCTYLAKIGLAPVFNMGSILGVNFDP